MEARPTLTFTDELGTHAHPIKTGPYVFGEQITCPVCIDRLRNLRLELCQKYGWSAWPFPKDYIDA